MDKQQGYEKQVVSHLLLFLQAMEQYRIWGKRATASDALRSDPQFVPAMRALLVALSMCAQDMQDLPKPPEDGWEADQSIRKLGQEIGQFAEILRTLIVTEDSAERGMIFAALAAKTKGMKQIYRQFGAQYDQVFPGRLDRMLNTLISSTLQTDSPLPVP